MEKDTHETTIANALTPVSDATTRKREKLVEREFWSKLRAFASRVPFAQDIVAAYYCARDPQTPTKVRATLLAALAYFIMPLDVMPDFLALVGLSDDMAVLTAALSMVKAHIKPCHVEQAQDALRRAADEEAA